MYTIGEFSKINRITTKTLRHYDKIGLLKPSRIESWTGYRYYNHIKLLEIKRILELRDMGFSLAEIKKLIDSKNYNIALIKEREAQLKEAIKKDEQRLNNIGNFLKSLEKGKIMENNIIIKSLPEVIVASMRTVVKGYDTYFDIVPKMGEYMSSVGAVCSEPAYCFTIYHDGEYKDNNIDVEICEAVIAPCKESEKVKFKTISSVPKAITIVHKGDYASIGKSYNQLFSWASNNNYEIIGKPRESYIDGIWNKEDSNEWTTEIQLPIK